MPNLIDVSFRKHTLNSTPTKITIYQKFGNHGLVIADYPFRNKRQYTMPDSETPTLIRWGRTPLGVSSFYGYVNHYETVTENSKTISRMFILGTSKLFNSSKPTTWHSMTHSGIARDFARRHNLRSVVTPSDRVLPAWSTGNRSDFASVNALADEIGYYTWVDGPTLYFVNSDRVLRSAANMQVPSLTRVRTAKVTAGRDAPGGDAPKRRVLYGLDYRSNEFFSATGGRPNLTVETLNAPANDYNQAVEVTRASGARDGNYFQLHATVEGDSAIYPGTLVYMEPDSVSTDQQGYWFVTEATHVVRNDEFVTEFRAVRGTEDGVRKKVSTVNSATRWNRAVIRNGTAWEAEVQEHLNA